MESTSERTRSVLRQIGVSVLRLIAIILICLPTFAGAKVIKQQETTFTYNGKTVPATIKTFERRGRTFEKMYIRVGAKTASCIPGDQKDCEAAIKEARRGRDR